MEPGQKQPISQAIAAIVERFPPNLQREVADYVDFLQQKLSRIPSKEEKAKEERQLTEDFMLLSSEALKEIWDNDEDAIYDRYKKS